MERVIFYIDGFNLYHSLEKDNRFKQHKWCNLRKLSEQFINPQHQKIRKVYYFSAICRWRKGKEKRHLLYVNALQHYGVEFIPGNYSKVQKNFRSKHMPILFIKPKWFKYFKFLQPDKIVFQTFEEKQTDVNIAVKLVEDAFLDRFDHAFIISGDSDLVPAIKSIKKNFPNKKITSILPPKSKGAVIQRTAHFRKQITESHLANSNLPNHIATSKLNIIKPSIY